MHQLSSSQAWPPDCGRRQAVAGRQLTGQLVEGQAEHRQPAADKLGHLACSRGSHTTWEEQAPGQCSDEGIMPAVHKDSAGRLGSSTNTEHHGPSRLSHWRWRAALSPLPLCAHRPTEGASPENLLFDRSRMARLGAAARVAGMGPLREFCRQSVQSSRVRCVGCNQNQGSSSSQLVARTGQLRQPHSTL